MSESIPKTGFIFHARVNADCRRSCIYFCHRLRPYADCRRQSSSIQASAYIPGKLAMISRVTVLSANVIMDDGAVNTDEALVPLLRRTIVYVTTRADYKDHERKKCVEGNLGEAGQGRQVKLWSNTRSSALHIAQSYCARQPVNDGFELCEEYLSPNNDKALYAKQGWRKMGPQAFNASSVKSLPFTNYHGSQLLICRPPINLINYVSRSPYLSWPMG